MKRPIDVLRQLVEQNLMYRWLISSKERTTAGHLRPSGRPGDFLDRMKPEDYAALYELKAEDMENDRWPLHDWQFDETEEDKQRREQRLHRSKLGEK